MNACAARFLILGSIALLAGCGPGPSNPFRKTTVLKIGFESDEGYLADRPLVGQMGWNYGFWGDVYGSAGHGVEGQYGGFSRHAFIGGVASTSRAKHDTVQVGLGYPVPATPAPGPNDVVEFKCEMTITDSSVGGRNYFEWVFYDARWHMLGGLMFDNSSLEVYRRRWNNSVSLTPLKFVRGRKMEVTVHFDLKNNKWKVMLDKDQLPDQQIVPHGRPKAELGIIAPVWWSDIYQKPATGPLAGDNRMIFDNLSVTFWPSDSGEVKVER